MNDPSPSFGFLVVLVTTFGIVVPTLGLILVVFIWTLFLPFLQPPTRCRSFFPPSTPFQVVHLRVLSYTMNTLEAMYEPEHTIVFHLQDLAASRCLCLFVSVPGLGI